MKTVNFILGTNAEQVKKEAQKYIGKWVKTQLAKDQREEAV